jgi:hypothetical protein
MKKYTTPRDSQEEEGNFNQGGRVQPGNNFGQQSGNNGQRPGGNNNHGQGQRPGGNNNFGQAQRPGGQNPDEGDNNFGEGNNRQQPNGFDREDKFKPSVGGTGHVGKRPDGSYGTGVQYVTKHPTLTEYKPTGPYPSQPGGYGGVKQPLEGHQRPSYNSKDPNGVPRESSASYLNNGALFVVSIIFTILHL